MLEESDANSNSGYMSELRDCAQERSVVYKKTVCLSYVAGKMAGNVACGLIREP